MTNVLDVGFLFCLVCAIPFSHNLAIHRHLNYCVVVAERLPIFNRFAFKLGSYVVPQRAQITSQSSNDLIVFQLALRLFTFHKLLALAHFLSHMFNECFPQMAYPLIFLLLELIALGIVHGNVFQFPIALCLALVVQRLVDKDMGATNLP